MKHYLLAGTSALALLAGAAGAHADTFNFTGKVVDFKILVTGTYDITAAGAQGGGFGVFLAGGLGAFAGGDVVLAAGTVLDIAVGGAGGNNEAVGGPGDAVGGPGGGGPGQQGKDGQNSSGGAGGMKGKGGSGGGYFEFNGGGGGYAGGGGGGYAGAGGGGSYVAADFTNPDLVTGGATSGGNGYVTVDLVSAAIPEPASLGLLGAGLLGLGLIRRRRRG